MDRLVDDLAEPQLEGDGTKDVGVGWGEAPARDEQVDHTRGCGAGCGGQIGAGFEDDPRVGDGVGLDGFAGFDDGAGERLLFVEMEAQGDIERALDAIDADFAVALCGVAVTTGEEGTGDEYWEVEAGADAEFADVEVAAEGAGRARAEGAVVRTGDAHDAEERAEGNDGGPERARGVGVELPMKEVVVAELILEEAEAFDGRGPAPAVVGGAEDVDLEDVAGLGAFDPDRPGECVNAGPVDAEEVLGGGARVNLAAAGVEALEVDGVARGDAQARRQSAVPDGVGGFGEKGVGGHGSCSLTVIWSSTSALRGRALTPMAART